MSTIEDTPTPRTDAYIDRVTRHGWRIGDTSWPNFARQLERELYAAQIPLCIGPPLIAILAKEGQWISQDGRGIVAADGLFKKDPYEQIAALEHALKLGLVVGYHQGWHEGDIADLGPRFYKLANATITQP